MVAPKVQRASQQATVSVSHNSTAGRHALNVQGTDARCLTTGGLRTPGLRAGCCCDSPTPQQS